MCFVLDRKVKCNANHMVKIHRTLNSVYYSVRKADIGTCPYAAEPRGGGTGPQLSAYRGLAALAPQLCDCDLVLHWCNSKIKATTTHPQSTCYILHVQTIPDGSPQFDVSFPGKLPKFVATIEARFSA